MRTCYTDEYKLRTLFANSKIRQSIQAQPSIHFQVQDDEGRFGTDFPEGVDELCFQVVGVIQDIAQLKPLYELFAETLNQLCRMGSAYEKDPNASLR